MTPKKTTWNPDGSMTVDDTGKNGDHICTKEAVFVLLSDHITDIKEDIAVIKIKIDETIIAASTAASSLEKYKIEVASFENGKNDAEEKLKLAQDLKKKEEKENWQRTIWIVMAVFAFIGLGMNLYFNIKGHNSTVHHVEAVQDTIRQEIRYQEGISKVKRSGYVLYNDEGLSDSIKIK
jgi:hypothetical protein